ncbi:SGNH/GDSL hydrolase family protein [Marinobacter zhejiangensis]|uniref:GDSL-like Lipase/Acylhydrolase n=1 Tax=Marinobacter zhejiangensis TaxID=488535 RepID=A0A1I4QB60_9GAMM|nr:SGNH/GDSL hydrolase family protein [Marinobacter zhejiangensis]SFM36860.1 GDSL-like Lipase/Acylhydrolase [Marinobacter zhejiangensis]
MKKMTSIPKQALPVRSVSSVFKLLFALVLAAGLTGCGGAGGLLSNPRVSDADNDQVVTIGDSIFALSGELQDFLEQDAGQTFRRYTLSGAELAGGAVATSIVDQYQIARSDNPAIDTIVMDGGGNDILIPAIMFDPYDCKTQWYEFGQLSSSCKNLINDIYVDGVNLLNDMHADGVDNVIYLGYYYTKNGLFLLDSMEEAVDYGDYRLAQACRYSAVNCQFVDPRSAINDSDIIADGIHPTTTGSRKLASLIWPKLQPLL